MRTLSKDKSTPKRGQRNTCKAEYGVCGDWLIAARWKWDESNEVFTVCMDDGERLHIAFVYTWEIDAVFKVWNSTYSFSKNLATKLLYEAVFKNGKSRIWVHGLVRPNVVDKQIIGFTEEHPERLKKIKAPWRQEAGGIPEMPVEPAPTKPTTAEMTFRL